MNSQEGNRISHRIEEVPQTTREHLIAVSLGPDEPRAMEWIEGPESGLYVDDAGLPLFEDDKHNIYSDSTLTNEWIRQQLDGLPTVGGV
jgi:hypothetical protein